MPRELAGQRACVRIEQQLVAVVAQAVRRIVRPVRTQPIDEAGHAVRRRQEAVPDVLGALRQREPRQLVLAARVEQAQLDAGRTAGVHGEIHAFAGPGGAERFG